MNTQSLYGISAILLSASVLVYTINSAQAIPSAQTISYGSNPVFSVGGVVSNASTTIITSPADQMMVVTDVVLSMNNNTCTSQVNFTDSAGTVVSSFKLHSKLRDSGYGATHAAPTSIQHAFNSGIPVAALDTLTISESGSCAVAYTLSGYYAHP